MRRQLLTGYGACPDVDHSTLTLVRIPHDRPRLSSAMARLRHANEGISEVPFQGLQDRFWTHIGTRAF